MYRLKVTIPPALERLTQQLRDRDRITRAAALNLLALISERIQNRGGLTAGGLIGGGLYTKQWAKKRRAAGRQTQYVDLTFSGRLLDQGFTVVLTPGGWGLGVPRSAAPIIEGLTARYGEFLQASEAELALAFKDIEHQVALIVTGSAAPRSAAPAVTATGSSLPSSSPLTGRRGGRYTINSSGRKVYKRRKP